LPLVKHRRQQREPARYLVFTIGGRHHITYDMAQTTNAARALPLRRPASRMQTSAWVGSAELKINGDCDLRPELQP
jgi:hypothetical protein